MDNLSGDGIVLLAGLVAVQIGNSFTINEIIRLAAFFDVLSKNLEVIVACRLPEDVEDIVL